MKYQTTGTCATQINFDLNNGIIHNVSFKDGCNGNLKAISALIEGRPATEIITMFKGHTCKSRPTSCVDQLAHALEDALNEHSAGQVQ